MAVSKLWAVKSRLATVINYAANPEKTSAENLWYQSLSDVIQYAKNEEKTEREFYVDGINCNVTTAREQFVTVKEMFAKNDGIQAYHGYLSFKEEDISPDVAHKIGMEFAKSVWGDRFQVVVSTHLNTTHLHCHFVINSVSFVDGKRLSNGEKLWYKFRHIADEICQKYGVNVIENSNNGKQSSYYYNLRKAGMPDRYELVKSVIDDAISRSESVAEFKYILSKLGYRYKMDEHLKYWTITPLNSKKSIRLYRLGDDYTNERIVERIKENRESSIFKPFQEQRIVVRQYRLPTMQDWIMKIGGIYGLYLLYCYKLGYYPKYKKTNPARVHYLLRDDLLKVEQLSQQVRLLGRENISTAEELFLYKSKVESEIEKLTSDRKHLRNEIRKVNIDDAMLQEKKSEIFAITERLKTLRKEIKLCDAIADRSLDMKDKLSVVLADEEKENRKERKGNEQQR